MEYVDFTFNNNQYGNVEKYTGDNALVLAVRNILLTRPGNFPFNPSMGMDIAKYQFDLLDDYTIEGIRTELNSQLNKYLPSTDGISVVLEKLEGPAGSKMLGIGVSTIGNSGELTANFLLRQDGMNNVDIFNEIY